MKNEEHSYKHYDIFTITDIKNGHESPMLICSIFQGNNMSVGFRLIYSTWWRPTMAFYKTFHLFVAFDAVHAPIQRGLSTADLAIQCLKSPCNATKVASLSCAMEPQAQTVRGSMHAPVWEDWSRESTKFRMIQGWEEMDLSSSHACGILPTLPRLAP